MPSIPIQGIIKKMLTVLVTLFVLSRSTQFVPQINTYF